MKRRKVELIQHVEDALKYIREGKQLFHGSHCLPAGFFKDWTVRKLMSVVTRRQLWLAEESN